MKLSRRELIGTALAVSTVSASAQAPSPSEQTRLNADALDKVELPQTAEPAFLFKA